MTSEGGYGLYKYIFKEGKNTVNQDGHPSFGTRLAKPYSHPCKADIYFCIFYRWIQCRPRTPLATLRNRVKWMYVLVSEIHVMFQLTVLDPNRPGFVFCKKRNRFPKGRTTSWFKWRSDFEENKNCFKIKSLQKGIKLCSANNWGIKSKFSMWWKRGMWERFCNLIDSFGETVIIALRSMQRRAGNPFSLVCTRMDSSKKRKQVSFYCS